MMVIAKTTRTMRLITILMKMTMKMIVSLMIMMIMVSTSRCRKDISTAEPMAVVFSGNQRLAAR